MKQCQASTDVAAGAYLCWQWTAALEQQESHFLLLGQHHACSSNTYAQEGGKQLRG